MNQEKWDKLHKELDDALDSEFGKAKVALRKYLLENKEKVANDLEEMRKKSNEYKMKKTAVQWLAIEWNRIDRKWKNVGQGDNHCLAEKEEALNQAKVMEKDQMCKFAYKCHNHYKVNGDFKIEQYYDETFKSE